MEYISVIMVVKLQIIRESNNGIDIQHGSSFNGSDIKRDQCYNGSDIISDPCFNWKIKNNHY